jgi:hypothetical protein
MSQSPEPIDRRSVQRVRLQEPLRATVDAARAFVIDVSLTGLRILHHEDIGLAGGPCVARFDWDGRQIELHCEIVRTTVFRAAESANTRTLYHSGLSIVRAVGASALTLRRLIQHYVERALDEQKANARGIPPLAAQSAQTGAPAAYVRHEYRHGQWREVMTPSSAQPEHGFTISAHHTPAEVEMLRRAYERGAANNDLEVFRRLAALSVSSGEIVQARRYMP